jgi:hypothetical protein
MLNWPNLPKSPNLHEQKHPMSPNGGPLPVLADRYKEMAQGGIWRS